MEMFNQMYYYPFFISFLLSVGMMFVLVWLNKKFKFKNNRDSERHIHNSKVSRLGGAAIIIGFLGAIFLDHNLVISAQLWGVIIATLVILAFGVWDDFWELDWKTQLFFQVAAAILIFIMGVHVDYVTNPLGGLVFLNLGKYLLPSLFFIIFWVIIVINSVNWLDGIDGLSSGVSLIGIATIFFLSLRPEVNQPPIGIITMALVGAILGFWLFNFYPAKILAGTSGSMFMGFMLAVLAIFAGAKIATALLVMSPAIIDALWVVGKRIKEGRSIFKADKRHLHHKLKELGWKETKISLFFYVFTIIIAIIALNTRTTGKLVSLVLIAVLMLSVLFYLSRKKISLQK
jgi:UDP-GlcNAc:undecaprenyl-phosphate/decaprenyl-phosphate GlcNAc-1-phosphate transferase